MSETAQRTRTRVTRNGRHSTSWN